MEPKDVKNLQHTNEGYRFKIKLAWRKLDGRKTPREKKLTPNKKKGRRNKRSPVTASNITKHICYGIQKFTLEKLS